MKGIKNISLFLVAAVFLIGCAEIQETAKTKTGQGAAIGAGVGAIAGGIIGHQSGHTGTGAVIGGLAGAAIGGTIGYQLDKQAKEIAQIPNTQVERKEDRLVVTMQEAVLFDVSSAILKQQSQDTLAKMAEVMTKYPDSDILVKGHTDSRGSEKLNQDLSERRAKAVKNYFIVKGVAERRITAIGLGKSMPVATNNTAEGRQKNRRVEIEIKPKPTTP